MPDYPDTFMLPAIEYSNTDVQVVLSDIFKAAGRPNNEASAGP